MKFLTAIFKFTSFQYSDFINCRPINCITPKIKDMSCNHHKYHQTFSSYESIVGGSCHSRRTKQNVVTSTKSMQSSHVSSSLALLIHKSHWLLYLSFSCSSYAHVLTFGMTSKTKHNTGIYTDCHLRISQLGHTVSKLILMLSVF